MYKSFNREKTLQQRIIRQRNLFKDEKLSNTETFLIHYCEINALDQNRINFNITHLAVAKGQKLVIGQPNTKAILSVSIAHREQKMASSEPIPPKSICELTLECIKSLYEVCAQLRMSEAAALPGMSRSARQDAQYKARWIQEAMNAEARARGSAETRIKLEADWVQNRCENLRCILFTHGFFLGRLEGRIPQSTDSGNYVVSLVFDLKEQISQLTSIEDKDGDDAIETRERIIDDIKFLGPAVSKWEEDCGLSRPNMCDFEIPFPQSG